MQGTRGAALSHRFFVRPRPHSPVYNLITVPSFYVSAQGCSSPPCPHYSRFEILSKGHPSHTPPEENSHILWKTPGRATRKDTALPACPNRHGYGWACPRRLKPAEKPLGFVLASASLKPCPSRSSISATTADSSVAQNARSVGMTTLVTRLMSGCGNV
jgi:hypothetical protein